MRRARARLIVAVVLFAGWLGYLAYLAATTRNPVVLSRPQFLVANLAVVAQVDRIDGQPPTVTIRQVVWPEDDKVALALVGQQRSVTNLSECSGWNGPCEYILVLLRDQDDFRLAPTPPSPGYHAGPGNRLPIYPVTPETQSQLRDIVGRLKLARADLGVQP